MKKALVIGGTGPTGPYIVNGLIDRGWDVAILHSGAHEVDFKREIEHIHADVHFRDTFEAALGNRSWDLVVASYGRLKLATELLKGRTARVVAMGGSYGSLASPEDSRWGAMGRASNLDEEGAWRRTTGSATSWAIRWGWPRRRCSRRTAKGTSMPPRSSTSGISTTR